MTKLVLDNQNGLLDRQDPTKGFGKSATGIDDARDVFQCDRATLCPLLDSKLLDMLAVETAVRNSASLLQTAVMP